MTAPAAQAARKGRVEVIRIKVSELLLNQELNRELRNVRVRWLVEKMDLDAVGVFAAWRDKETRRLYVIDGQHRKVALEELGLGEWEVNCQVFRNKTFAQACDLFLKLNHGLSIRPYDRFDKGVKAGRHEYLGSKAIVEKHGFKVDRCGSRDGCLTAIAAALETWNLDEGRALDSTLGVIVAAFGHKAAGIEGHMVRGLGRVFARYSVQIDSDALVKKLQKYPGGASGILGHAKSLKEFYQGPIAVHVGNVVIESYNKGRRDKLGPL